MCVPKILATAIISIIAVRYDMSLASAGTGKQEPIWVLFKMNLNYTLLHRDYMSLHIYAFIYVSS